MQNSSPLTREQWYVGRSINKDVYNGEEHFCIMDDTGLNFGQVIADIELAPDAEQIANLMAAAPAMRIALIALEPLLQYAQEKGGYEKEIEQAYAALAMVS